MLHFELGEKSLLEAAKPYSANSHQNPKERIFIGSQKSGEVTEAQK
jgi:hypothetical protein